MPGGGGRIERRYDEQQRAAVAFAYGEHGAKEIAELAARGKLPAVDGGFVPAFDLHWNSVATIAKRARKRRYAPEDDGLSPAVASRLFRRLSRRARHLATVAMTPTEVRQAARLLSDLEAMRAQWGPGGPVEEMAKRSALADEILDALRQARPIVGYTPAGAPLFGKSGEPEPEPPQTPAPAPAKPEPQPQPKTPREELEEVLEEIRAKIAEAKAAPPPLTLEEYAMQERRRVLAQWEQPDAPSSSGDLARGRRRR